MNKSNSKIIYKLKVRNVLILCITSFNSHRLNNVTSMKQTCDLTQINIVINNPWSISQRIVHSHNNLWILIIQISNHKNYILNIVLIMILSDNSICDYKNQKIEYYNFILIINLSINPTINMYNNIIIRLNTINIHLDRIYPSKLMIYIIIINDKDIIYTIIDSLIIITRTKISYNDLIIEQSFNLTHCKDHIYEIIINTINSQINVWNLTNYVIHTIYIEYNLIVYYTKLSYKISSIINWWWLKSSI